LLLLFIIEERQCHFNVLATAGGVLRKKSSLFFLVWDMD
jgi:hypothetical protein